MDVLLTHRWKVTGPSSFLLIGVSPANWKNTSGSGVCCLAHTTEGNLGVRNPAEVTTIQCRLKRTRSFTAPLSWHLYANIFTDPLSSWWWLCPHYHWHRRLITVPLVIGYRWKSRHTIRWTNILLSRSLIWNTFNLIVSLFSCCSTLLVGSAVVNRPFLINKEVI